jgi:hypothetical protein
MIRGEDWELPHTISGISNTLFAYVFLANQLLEYNISKGFIALITVAAGVAYLLPILIFYSLKMMDRIRVFNIGRLALTSTVLLTTAIPIRWEGYEAIIGWTIEMGLLMWLGTKIKKILFNYFALFLGGLTILFLWVESASAGLSKGWFFNPQTLSYLLLAGAFVMSGVLFNQLKGDRAKGSVILCHIAWSMLLFIWLSIEVNLYFTLRNIVSSSLQFNLKQLVMSVVWLVYSLVLFGLGYIRKIQENPVVPNYCNGSVWGIHFENFLIRFMGAGYFIPYWFFSFPRYYSALCIVSLSETEQIKKWGVGDGRKAV